jgi:hypothetical protein
VPTPPKEVAHLLRRAGFGGSRAHITELAALDRAALVDHVLDLTNALVDTPPASVSNPSVSGWDRYVDLCNWWYNRMATSPTPIVEKMTLLARPLYDELFRHPEPSVDLRPKRTLSGACVG